MDSWWKSISRLLPVVAVCALAHQLAAQGFSPGQILNGQARQLRSTCAADLDGDGDPDLLTASTSDSKIAWYPNLGGQGSYGPQRIVSDDVDLAAWVTAGDLDGDGDVDVVSTALGDNEIAWHENLDGKGTFGPEIVISDVAIQSHAAHLVDLDSDGDLDVLSTRGWNSVTVDTLFWHANLDGLGTFGPERVIARNLDSATGVHAADLDGDWDIDVLVSTYYDDTISWFENTDWGGVFGPRQVITAEADGAALVSTADLDGDGDQDLLSGTWRDGVVSWYENTTGGADFGPKQDIVVEEAMYASRAQVSDLDGDGDLDVLSMYHDMVTLDTVLSWSENLDGLGAFAPPRIITYGPSHGAAILAVDDDGDGDRDVFSGFAFDPGLSRHENTDGQGTFGPREPITTWADGAYHVVAHDLDGDGDLDAISASYDDGKIAWYENLDGQGTFSVERVITTAADKAASVDAADIDGDGDLDVLATSRFHDVVVWFPNTDGLGTFGAHRIVTDLAEAVMKAIAADVDGDGDPDVLYTSWRDDEVAWHENVDGAGNFGAKQLITDQAIGAQGLFAADLDGDGDLDVLVASTDDDTVAWFENEDGAGGFGPERTITSAAHSAQAVWAADLDRDGDLDVLAASSGDDTVAWFENEDGLGTFSSANVLAADAGNVWDVCAADVDADGDCDVLWSGAGNVYTGDYEVAWHENLDAQGEFGPKQFIETAERTPRSVFAADLDGDGDQDALVTFNGTNKVAWYERDGEPPQASASFRNAGTNPASHFAVNAPAIGTTYLALVDLVGTTGHPLAMLAAFDAPLTFTLSGGQTLLVDPGGTELFGLPVAAGPHATFALSVPTDLAFVGWSVHTQAVHIGPTQPLALSNAQDLILGF